MLAVTQPSERIREVARFTLPIGVPVAVLARPGIELPALDAPAWRLPEGEGPAPPGNGAELIDQLELLRERRAAFLLIPASEVSYLEGHRSFKEYVERGYREVLREDGVCTIFALHELGKGDTFAPPDGLPLPPPEMVIQTLGFTRKFPDLYERFYQGGATAARSIEEILAGSGRGLEEFESILDFGCGCGRVIRHWRSLQPAHLHGCDYNPYFVEWCRANLPFADFRVNGPVPRLDYADSSFDLVCAMSVFTHLDEEIQLPWVSELTRVVKPGGLLLLTFHGRSHMEHLEGERLERFQAGELVTLQSEFSGTNACAAFHPERYVRDTLARGLTVLAFVPEGNRENRQDAALLERPAA